MFISVYKFIIKLTKTFHEFQKDTTHGGQIKKDTLCTQKKKKKGHSQQRKMKIMEGGTREGSLSFQQYIYDNYFFCYMSFSRALLRF